MKKSLIFLFVLFIGLYSCKEQPKIDEAYMMELQSQVENTKKNLPVNLGPIRYVGVELDKDAGTLTHSYQYANNPQVTDEMKEGVKQTMITMMESAPTERKPIEKGLKMHFKYYSKDKDLLFTITVTPDDLGL